MIGRLNQRVVWQVIRWPVSAKLVRTRRVYWTWREKDLWDNHTHKKNVDRIQYSMSCGAEERFKDDQFKQLGRSVILRDREYRRNLWKDGEFSPEPDEFEGPMGLKCSAGCWVCRFKAQWKSSLKIKIWEPSMCFWCLQP